MTPTEELSTETGLSAAAILDKIFTSINNLYIQPEEFDPSSSSNHNIVVYEPCTSFRFNYGTTIDIDIRLSNPKSKNKFSNA